MRRQRLAASVAAAALALTGSVAASAPATATASPYCGITWGSFPKVYDDENDQGWIHNIRSGRHECFDRLVIDIADPVEQGYRVRYVDVVRGIGSGLPIPTRGGAAIEVVALAPAYDPHTGDQTYHFADPQELVDVSGYDTFRQVAWGGSFEGATLLALGVRARLPMRTFTLSGPGGNSRLVIDVAHRW